MVYNNDVDKLSPDTTTTKPSSKMDTTTTIVVLNPNSSSHITSALAARMKPPPSTKLIFLTAPPDAPAQIIDEETSNYSTEACLTFILDYCTRKKEVQGVLIACFSDHPLVHHLREKLPHLSVLGIFDASLYASLSIGKPFGVVTTALYWKDVLDDSVKKLSASHLFQGTETTGLSVLDLHDAPQDLVKQRVQEATRRLIAKGARTVIMGCAGMTGMDEWITDELANAYGKGASFRVIDGVHVGIELLPSLIRGTS